MTTSAEHVIAHPELLSRQALSPGPLGSLRARPCGIERAESESTRCFRRDGDYNSQKGVRSRVSGLQRDPVRFSAVGDLPRPDVGTVLAPGGWGGPVGGRASWSRPRDASPGGGDGE